MNATDLIVAGLLVIAGGLWLDAAGLPGAVMPIFDFHVSVIGLGVFVLGMWRAGRATARPDG